MFVGADEPLQTERRGGVHAVPALCWLVGMVVRVGGERDLEILVLRHQLAILSRRGRRPRYTTADRAFLAAASRLLPLERWSCFVVSPWTLRRWHRALLRGRRRGRRLRRPPLPAETASLIVRLGRENPGWGYMRIQGELLGIGVRVSATTVANVLRRYGLGPAPRRIGPTWSQFLRAQAHSLLAGGTDLGLVDGYRDTAAVSAEHRAGDPVGAHLNPFPDSPGEAQLVARLVPVPNRVAPPSILIATQGRPCLLLSHRTRARDGPVTQPCRHPAPGDQRRRPSWSGPAPPRVAEYRTRTTRRPLASRKRLTRSPTRTSGSSFFTPHANTQ